MSEQLNKTAPHSAHIIRKRRPLDASPADQAPRVVGIRERREEFVGVASQIAESSMFKRNYRFKDAEKYFPFQPRLRCVDKCYPNAKGGMLLVDEPHFQSEIEECKKKAEVLKKLGYRYLIVTKETKTQDAYEALQKGSAI